MYNLRHRHQLYKATRVLIDRIRDYNIALRRRWMMERNILKKHLAERISEEFTAPASIAQSNACGYIA